MLAGGFKEISPSGKGMKSRFPLMTEIAGEPNWSKSYGAAVHQNK